MGVCAGLDGKLKQKPKQILPDKGGMPGVPEVCFSLLNCQQGKTLSLSQLGLGINYFLSL